VTQGGTVAVHGGRWGEAILAGLRASSPDVHFVPADGPEARADADALATMADEASAMGKVLHPGIRWVHVLAAGVDGFPLELTGDRVVTCSRGASAPAIAEFVLAAMLAFEKRLPQSWITAPPEAWNVANLGGLAGRRLGLVGIGAIGTEIARRALAFDMRVSAVRRRPEPVSVAGVDLCAGLGDLLPTADHVVVAAPATPATERLFDKSAFAAMKPGAHFVNVARGTLVDQPALVEALDAGQVALASLDVVDPEPLPAGHELYRNPGVRLSPHISWSSPRTVRRTFELFVENLDRFRRGAPLASIVDVEAGY
jgi:phosphoglycerate dehydrogenase-like enzyme